MKKKKNIVIYIILILMFILSPITKADSQEEGSTDGGTSNGEFVAGSKITDSIVAGNLAANFAKEYISQHGDECVYDIGHCENGYYQIRTSSPTKLDYHKDANGNWLEVNEPYENKYPFECTNFVAFIYKETFGIIPYNTLYVTIGNNPNPTYFEIIHTTNYLPGDILRYNGHVAIAINESYMMEARGVNSTPEVGQASIRSGVVEVLRLKINENNPLELKKDTDGTIEDIKPPSDETVEGGVNQYIDSYKPKVTIPDQDSFKFQGTAKENFEGMGNRLDDLKAGAEAIVNFLKDAFTWILGIMFYPIKVILIGWIQLGQDAFSGILSVATGTEIEGVNIEDIIFNKIQLLDINIFSNTPGGTAVVEGSVVDIIRDVIVTWYTVFRKIAIIGMLITLLYLGIRIALNTIPEGKAKYKQMLVGWFFGFAIIFFIHYFIVGAITLNESLLQLIPHNTELGTTVFEEIEAGMYQVNLAKSLAHILVFLVLFIYTLKFFYVYLKRLLTVLILIMMAPLMGITYAIDRINGNKTSSHFTTWIQEFSVNVFIQLAHGIIYVVFVSSILGIIQQSGNIAAIIIVCIILHFMMEAEHLIKKMFKLDKGKSLKDIAQATKGIETATTAVLAGSMAKKIGSMYVSGAKKLGKVVMAPWKDMRSGRWENGGQQEEIPQGRTLTDIDDRIKEEKEKQDKGAEQIRKELGKFSINVIAGGVQTVMGVPMMVFSPAVGITTFTKGVERLKEAYGSGTKVMHTKKRNLKGPVPTRRQKAYRFVSGKFKTDFFRGIAPDALTEAYSDYKNSPEKFKNMEQAKNIEIQLAMYLEELKDEKLIVEIPKRNMFGEVINGDKNATSEQIKATKEFNKALNNIIEGTSRKNVQKAVSKYFLETTAKTLTLKDVQGIAQGLENIKVTEEFGANFKSTLKLEIMNSALSSNELSDDKTRITIDKKLKTQIKNEAKNARKHYKEIKPDNLTKKEEKAQENEHIYEALDKKIDDEVIDNVLEKMSVEDLTRVIHKTILQKDSIKQVNTRPEFTPVLEKLQELNTLNEETKYNTGDAIYNIDDIVKQMKSELTKKDVF